MSCIKTGLLIYTNGTTEEKTLDMSEDTNNISILLGDKLTFIGQILREPDKCNAVIMNGINSKNNGKLLNRCIIPPFNEEIYGDMFIICMDEIVNHKIIKDLEEYIKILKKNIKKLL